MSGHYNFEGIKNSKKIPLLHDMNYVYSPFFVEDLECRGPRRGKSKGIVSPLFSPLSSDIGWSLVVAISSDDEGVKTS